MPPTKKTKKMKSEASEARDSLDGEIVADPGIAVAEGSTPEVTVDYVDLPVISSGVTLESMKEITHEFKQCVYDFWQSAKTNEGLEILEQASRYEELIMKLLVENERLRGRLEVFTSGSYVTKVASAAVKAAARAVYPVAGPAVAPTAAVPVAAPVVTPAAVPVIIGSNVGVPVPKPVETWSVIVRGEEGVSSKEVVERVVRQVGPTLGVRVHEVKPIRDGGAVVRVPSVAEREKVVKNEKFKEVGLDVSVNEKPGPRIVVCNVPRGISVDEFMTGLYEMNLKEHMPMKEFRKKCYLASNSWKTDGDGEINVVLQGEEMVMRRLLEAGRVYVKWFSFKVRLQDSIPHCFRCLGFDHRIRECRMREEVCRLCGTSGHRAVQCNGGVRCRDCAFRGLPADHRMLSHSCPVYVGLVARANARH